jgi:hypothetical protein
MRPIPASGWWGLPSAGGGIATVTLQRMTRDQLGDEFGVGTHDWAFLTAPHGDPIGLARPGSASRRSGRNSPCRRPTAREGHPRQDGLDRHEARSSHSRCTHQGGCRGCGCLRTGCGCPRRCRRLGTLDAAPVFDIDAGLTDHIRPSRSHTSPHGPFRGLFGPVTNVCTNRRLDPPVPVRTRADALGPGLTSHSLLNGGWPRLLSGRRPRTS